MTEHTKEPWFHDGDAIYNNADCVGNPIAHVLSCAYDSDLNNIDARRIVACVNACAAISTERLEMALPGQMKSSLDRLFAEIEELTSQRDQLLAALEKYEAAFDSLFVQCCSNPIRNAWGEEVNLSLLNEAHHAAGPAIAAVKGGPIPSAPEGDTCPFCRGKSNHIDDCDNCSGTGFEPKGGAA